MTEERRKELAKQAKVLCDEAKVSVRNNRRDYVEKVKGAEKGKEIDKDTSKFYQVRPVYVCMYMHVLYLKIFYFVIANECTLHHVYLILLKTIFGLIYTYRMSFRS